MSLRVSLGFVRTPEAELGTIVRNVIEGMTGNPAFPAPPVSLAEVEIALADFAAKRAAAEGGGTRDTVIKNSSRQALVSQLRELAAYAQFQSRNDLSVLLSSGFQAMSNNRSPRPLAKPDLRNISNGGSGKLIAGVTRIPNARLYEGRAREASGEWLPSLFSGNSKRIIFSGLKPGTLYTIQVRALGGSTGQSDWSDPRSHMSL